MNTLVRPLPVLVPEGVESIIHPVLVPKRPLVPLQVRKRFADLIMHLVLILLYPKPLGLCLVAIWTRPLPMTNLSPLMLVLTALLKRLRTALHPNTQVTQLIGYKLPTVIIRILPVPLVLIAEWNMK